MKKTNKNLVIFLGMLTAIFALWITLLKITPKQNLTSQQVNQKVETTQQEKEAYVSQLDEQETIKAGDVLLEQTVWKERQPKEDGEEVTSNSDVRLGVELARYTIDENDELILGKNALLSESEKEHAVRYFKRVLAIIPKDWRTELDFFYVYKESQFAASIYSDEQHTKEAEYWLDIDFDKAISEYGGEMAEKIRLETMIHEFAHLFSFNSSQIDASKLSSDVYVDAFKESSYMKEFYRLFWKDAPEKYWSKELTDQDVYAFYKEHGHAFLSAYAATNMAEDFAESFRYFVFTQSTDIDEKSKADEKIKFFYQYKELIHLRHQLLKNIVETSF